MKATVKASITYSISKKSNRKSACAIFPTKWCQEVKCIITDIGGHYNAERAQIKESWWFMGPGVQEKEKAYKWKNTQYRARVEKSVFKSLQLRWTWKRHLREDLAEVPPIKRILNWGSWAKNASIHKSKDVCRGNSYQRLCFNGCVPYLVCVCVREQLSPLKPGK